MSLELIEPEESYQSAFLEFCEAFRAAGEAERFNEALARKDFAAFLDYFRKAKQGINLPIGYVAQTTYWLVVDGKRIMAASNLRHRLNEKLLNGGGHIGYAVHPLERRKGYGTCILRLTLVKAKEMGLERVLVTCDTDNIGSARVIQINGGILENETIDVTDGKPIARYWITL